uniref:Uncharacterized protein n=1 Tax=Anguilla anguilla TaxID=7936 RepID=A0A0E9XGF6_ANGAN
MNIMLIIISLTTLLYFQCQVGARARFYGKGYFCK